MTWYYGLTLVCSLYAIWLLGAYAVGRSIREDMETDDDDQS